MHHVHALCTWRLEDDGIGLSGTGVTGGCLFIFFQLHNKVINAFSLEKFPLDENVLNDHVFTPLK